MERLHSSVLHHPVCTIVLSTFLHMCCFSRKWRWCDDAKTILPWHNNYGTVEHRFIAIVLSSSCPRITAIVSLPSYHRIIVASYNCVIVSSLSHHRVIAFALTSSCRRHRIVALSLHRTDLDVAIVNRMVQFGFLISPTTWLAVGNRLYLPIHSSPHNVSLCLVMSMLFILNREGKKIVKENTEVISNGSQWNFSFSTPPPQKTPKICQIITRKKKKYAPMPFLTN